MNINLKRLKDLLEHQGVVRVEVYEVDKELAINEQYFCYNEDTGGCDLYYIGIKFEDGQFKVETHFCDKDFLDMYDNQLEYINKVIETIIVVDSLTILKEALEQDGFVRVEEYEADKELAINEQYFCYNEDTGECDLYYIGITFEDGQFKVKTHFCDEDFLDLYDNQLDYINDFINRFNQRYSL